MDWNERLERAEKRGHFTNANFRLAGAWRTCAVGERAEQLGEPLTGNPNNMPKSVKDAGAAFYGAMWANDIPLARKLYARIQRWGARRKAKA